jgi:hypothetical protein
VAEAENLSQEELLEQIRRMKVSDLLLTTITTVAQLGYAKLDPAGRDLEQAKLAIDSMSVLVPVLESSAPDEVIAQFKQLTSDLQLAYAQAADEELGAGPEDSPEGEPGGEQ